MTLDSVEQLIKRFVSIFLMPLVNLILVSGIVYSVSGGFGVSGVSGTKYEGLFNYVVDLVSGFIKGDFKSLLDTLTQHQKQVKDVSTLILTVTAILVVVSAYLLDRIVFYIGYLVPPSIQFDLDAYGRSGASHVDKLMRIAGESSNFVSTYGAIRAYLGHKNTDQYRLAVRSKLTGAIERSRAVISYTKSYLLLCCLLAALDLWEPYFSMTRVGAAAVVLICALVIGCLLYANVFRQLVEYDIDSFIWEQAYNSAPPVKGLALPEPQIDPSDRKLGAVERILKRKCLKLALFERLHS
jgi:hypothetical protein